MKKKKHCVTPEAERTQHVFPWFSAQWLHLILIVLLLNIFLHYVLKCYESSQC